MENSKIISICQLVRTDGKNVSAKIADTFKVSRQTASSWLAQLKKLQLIESTGSGRGIEYYLLDVAKKSATYNREGLSEDVVWRELCAPMVKDLPQNVRNIWHHGITEMVNNAIDHSGSENVTVTISRNIYSTKCVVMDTGEGIFLKIQRALNLYDPREAILELAKGKLTTDPTNHSGEGIFFSSKMFDSFIISSGDLAFVHLDKNLEDVLLSRKDEIKGTKVLMELENQSIRTSQEVFDKFALPEDFSFAKTIVPVKLAQHEGETLVSRSQAKRLTRRFEKFQSVIVDFDGVAEIGQAFADEVFRVFANAHPKINMIPTNMTAKVKAMVNRVTNSN
ncbi:STAS-like domain-containing protein [Undibacterium danionis]|uniref:STAS-like domain-containing protein n=1 Tax=Undibacterium danionis TaxID=1812100 RepID=A0ABV6ICR7_9BURK